MPPKPKKPKDKFWAYTYLDERGVPGIKIHKGSVGGIFIACRAKKLAPIQIEEIEEEDFDALEA